MFARLHSAELESRTDSIAPLIKEKMYKTLADSNTHGCQFGLLKRYITIRSCDDTVRFFSWNEGTGGTWLSVVALAQITAPGKRIFVQNLTNHGLLQQEIDYTDSEIYEVYGLWINKQKHYLTFAWGTHGSGQQHQLIKIYRLNGGQLEGCPECIKQNYTIIQYQRGDTSNLRYDPENQTISFNKFMWNDKEGYYTPTGETIQLKFTGTMFERQ